MRLVDIVRQETGVDFDKITLVRHFNSIDRLLDLGGSIEEFTAVQPKGKKWDFWRAGRPKTQVLVVIVRDRVFGVFFVRDVQKEGRFESLASQPLQEFDKERFELYDPNHLVRLFVLERVACTATEQRITGWEGREINPIVRDNAKLFFEIEVESHIDARHPALPDIQEALSRSDDPTTRLALAEARIGQGRFRLEVLTAWDFRCCVTGSTTLAAIRASHIKPWRDSTNAERLDAANGLPLVATIDALFDTGLVTFTSAGTLVPSQTINANERLALGLGQMAFLTSPTKRTWEYLKHHRENVFVDHARMK